MQGRVGREGRLHVAMRRRGRGKGESTARLLIPSKVKKTKKLASTTPRQKSLERPRQNSTFAMPEFPPRYARIPPRYAKDKPMVDEDRCDAGAGAITRMMRHKGNS